MDGWMRYMDEVQVFMGWTAYGLGTALVRHIPCS